MESRSQNPKRQMCSCGHVQNSHNYTVSGLLMLAVGQQTYPHGRCEIVNCECKQYTWVPMPNIRKENIQ